jgi:heterotetrameric sarcosine oxidase gamma subunit
MLNDDPPIARGPLIERQHRDGALIDVLDGWEVVTRSPPPANSNAIVDRSHRATFEINGPQTGKRLSSLCGRELPVRSVHVAPEWDAYRLTLDRALLVGKAPAGHEGIDVTGGWASLALSGPDAERILSKVTAVDLRLRTLPEKSCCQGPIFGMNVLMARFDNRFELHVNSDSAEFLYDVLADAGAEFQLRA